MYQKIKAKFKANPTIFYACSIVASWAGVGSLMNFRTLAINNGAAAAIIWAVFNSLACILFGLFAEYIPTVRRLMQSKVMFYFIGFLTVFQTWTQMSGIYEIFGDTPIGTTGGTLIVYGTCIVFLLLLLKDGMIRNVLSDGFSWVVVYGLLAVVVVAALVYTRGNFVNIDPMKAIVKKLMDEGKTVDEIGKQLGMKPEEIFRLSGFTKDEFLNMMTKDHPTYSKAKVIRSI